MTEFMDWYPVWVEDGLGTDQLTPKVCTECGSLVVMPGAHAKWHARQVAKAA